MIKARAIKGLNRSHLPSISPAFPATIGAAKLVPALRNFFVGSTDDTKWIGQLLSPPKARTSGLTLQPSLPWPTQLYDAFVISPDVKSYEYAPTPRPLTISEGA